MAILIDGKAWAAHDRAQTAAAAAKLADSGVKAGLAVVLIGEHPASMSYVRGKDRAAAEVGIHAEVIRLPSSTTQTALLGLIRELNGDERFHGILVQLPLPAHINERSVIEAIAPRKDVDGFHPVNVGALALGMPGMVPCTPLGVMRLFEYEHIALEGKHAVVIGRSQIVGKPLAQLLLAANATVTVCHSRTTDLALLTRQADILIAAIGKPRFVTGDMVRPGSVVIDVGINRIDGKLCGDVDFASVAPTASHITPVPGGVGPMTIAALLSNTVKGASAHA